MKRKIFPLSSRLVFTPQVLERVPRQDMMEAFGRHDSGDWGIVSKKVIEENNKSLRRGGRLKSEYVARNGARFSVTTLSENHVTEFDII